VDRSTGFCRIATSSAFNRLIHKSSMAAILVTQSSFLYFPVVGVVAHRRRYSTERNLLSSCGQWNWSRTTDALMNGSFIMLTQGKRNDFLFGIFLFTCNVHVGRRLHAGELIDESYGRKPTRAAAAAARSHGNAPSRRLHHTWLLRQTESVCLLDLLYCTSHHALT